MQAADHPRELTGLAGWVDRRTRLRPVWAALIHVRIPIGAKTFYLGGLTLMLFAVQAVTGILLTLYYQPTPEAAYDSVRMITGEVMFGWLIRSVHHWGANLMMLTLFLHMIRIFYQAAYKYPRELIWIVGGFMLLVSIGFGFTGYLLPWDQKAYWATIVGTEIAGSVPVVGEALLQLLRGGAEVTGATLTRFFGIHVMVLPVALAGLIVIHLTLVHQLGLADPTRPDPRPGRGRPAVAPRVNLEAAAEDDEDAAIPAGQEAATANGRGGRTKPFFPNYVVDELLAWYVVVGVLVVLSSVFPAGLEEQANPLETPAHIKPEWYFLWLFELLKIVPRIVGVVGPVVAIGILVIWPLLDRNPEVQARRRLLAVTGATLIIAAIVALTIYGLVV